MTTKISLVRGKHRNMMEIRGKKVRKVELIPTPECEAGYSPGLYLKLLFERVYLFMTEYQKKDS